MFDILKELEKDLVGLYKLNKIKIDNILEKCLKISLNVLTIENNKVMILLNETKINDKDKIDKLLKENEEIKKELKLKDNKIDHLENEIKKFKKWVYKF